MITTYQIRNVLRVYGNQLKRRNTTPQNEVEPTPHVREFVDISIEARRKAMLDQVSNDLISQITPKDSNKNTTEKNPADNPQD